MKSIITFALLLIATIGATANDDKYINAMKKNIQSVYEAQTIPDWQAAVNSLQRIADAEKTKWEPFYYISFGYIMMASQENDGGKKDAYLDLAKAAQTKAAELNQNDSEITALDGFIYMIRLTVDPATRGPKYSALASSTLQKALVINGSNPRAVALLARMQFGTAQFFNQPPTEACANANKAVTLFDNDKSENPLAPRWGKGMAQDMTKNCQ